MGSSREEVAGGQRISDLETQAQLDRQLIAYLKDAKIADALQIENLQTALRTARRIGFAIGILMEREKITDTAAFELLSKTATTMERKLRTVAEDVILTGALPAPVARRHKD